MFFKTKLPSSEQIQQLMQLFAENRLEELIEQGNEITGSFPKAAQPHNILSVAYNAAGDYQSALLHAEKAIRIQPNYVKAHVNKGNALSNMGRNDEALASYYEAVEIDPEFAEGFNNLGAFLLKLNRHEEAVDCFSRAVELKPDYVMALNNLGCTLLDLGQNDEASLYLNQAIELKPDYALAHRNLSTMKKYKDGDPQILQMKELLSSEELSDQQRMHLCFALAKAEDEVGNIDDAFHHFQQANKIAKAVSGYHIDEDKALFNEIKALFSPPSLPSPSESTPAEITPLFIVGMPRSGTTLVEQILSSHSEVYAAGEVDTLSQAVNSTAWNHGLAIDSDQLAGLRNHYLSWLQELDIEERYITDKTTINFRWIGYILQAFPEARIVHIKRDAMATCWSNYKLFFDGSEHSYVYDLDDISEYYKMYVDLMNFWEQRFPGKIHHINYENLTISQEEETRKLLDYCGLDWEDQCMDFHLSSRAIPTASTQQVRQKMYQGSSDVWRKYESYLQATVKKLENF